MTKSQYVYVTKEAMSEPMPHLEAFKMLQDSRKILHRHVARGVFLVCKSGYAPINIMGNFQLDPANELCCHHGLRKITV